MRQQNSVLAMTGATFNLQRGRLCFVSCRASDVFVGALDVDRS